MPQTAIDAHSARATAPAGRLPDFVIIGGMKCGSTTLFEYLCRHSGVFMCEPKEPGYFSREKVMARGETWYRSLFAGVNEHQLCGEASTCYSRWPHFGDVAQRVAKALPDAKLVYIMRHPVDRAYSHYAHVFHEHHMLGKPFDLTFEQALEASPEYVDASLYLTQIEQYLRFFPRQQLLPLVLDEFNADPAQTLAELQQFLGLVQEDLLAGGIIVANKGDGIRVARRRLREKLQAIRYTPGVKQAIDIVPGNVRRNARSFLVDTLSQTFVGKRIAREQKAKQSPMRPETRPKLLEVFRQPNRDLEKFLGRALPANWFK